MCELMSVIRGESAIQFASIKTQPRMTQEVFLYIIIEGEGFLYYL